MNMIRTKLMLLGNDAILRGEALIEFLKEFDAYYECPKDASGKRLGPLVQYAAKDGTGRNFVGDLYLNLRKPGKYRISRNAIARGAAHSVRDSGIHIDTIVGMPMSGLPYAQAVADILDAGSVSMKKEGQNLELCDTVEGEDVAIGEELVNNFSTTKKAIKQILKAGGRVVAIICMFNRSPLIGYRYLDEEAGDVLHIPVISAVHRELPEYQQDDPAVVDDIAAGNLETEPKKPENWAHLQEIQQKYAV